MLVCVDKTSISLLVASTNWRLSLASGLVLFISEAFSFRVCSNKMNGSVREFRRFGQVFSGLTRKFFFGCSPTSSRIRVALVPRNGAAEWRYWLKEAAVARAAGTLALRRPDLEPPIFHRCHEPSIKGPDWSEDFSQPPSPQPPYAHAPRLTRVGPATPPPTSVAPTSRLDCAAYHSQEIFSRFALHGPASIHRAIP